MPRSCADQLVDFGARGALIVDDKLGLLRVERYDTALDELVVRSADRHRDLHVTQLKKELPVQSSTKLHKASERSLAEIGDANSLNLIKTRAERLVGVKRPGLFFASILIDSRLHSPRVSPFWRERIWPSVLEAVRRKNLNLELPVGPEDLTMAISRTVRSLNDYRAKYLLAVVQEVYAQTGEDLIRSGLLFDYSTYRSSWRWVAWVAQRSGALKAIGRVCHWLSPGGGEVRTHMPQDVDHFVRSYLWRNSMTLFKLVPGDALPRATLTLSELELIPRTIPNDVPPRYPGSSKWRNIFETFGTVVLPEQNFEGENVRLDVAADESEYVVAETMRELFDRGAESVAVLIDPTANKFSVRTP